MSYPLRQIQAELEQLAAAADDEHPIDPFEVRLIARKIGAQAEALELGLGE